jgi:hypothetical protein
MSTKHYCDRCEKQMTPRAERLRVLEHANGHVFVVEALMAVDGVCNGGHMSALSRLACDPCILAIFAGANPGFIYRGEPLDDAEEDHKYAEGAE